MITNNIKTRSIYFLVIVLCIGLYFIISYVRHINKTSSLTAKINIEESGMIRLSLNGKELKYMTNSYSNTRNFVFLDSKTGDVVTTLSLENPALGSPSYEIIKGTSHDWLVVSRLENWGTGLRYDIDDWYILGYVGTMKKVLSYRSESLEVPGSNGKNEYMKTDIISRDDSNIDIKFINKECTVKEDGEDKDCIESSKVNQYVWDSGKEEFMLSKKANPR